MKTHQKSFLPKEHGSPYLQFLERRSIPLYREEERHLASFPIFIDRGVFVKAPEERINIKFAKKDWKNSLLPNYKPQLLIRA